MQDRIVAEAVDMVSLTEQEDLLRMYQMGGIFFPPLSQWDQDSTVHHVLSFPSLLRERQSTRATFPSHGTELLDLRKLFFPPNL